LGTPSALDWSPQCLRSLGIDQGAVRPHGANVDLCDAFYQNTKNQKKQKTTNNNKKQTQKKQKTNTNKHKTKHKTKHKN